MQAELIHPLDMSAKIMSRKELISVIYSERQPVDDLIEIDGKLYYQTVRVPATTKDIS